MAALATGSSNTDLLDSSGVQSGSLSGSQSGSQPAGMIINSVNMNQASHLPPKFDEIQDKSTPEQVSLSQSNSTLLDEIRKEFGKLRGNINRDFEVSKKDYNDKFVSMEAKLLLDQHNKFKELIDIFGTHKEEVNEEVKSLKAKSDSDDMAIKDLKETVATHLGKLDQLETTLADKDTRMIEIEDRLNKYIESNDKRIVRVQEGVDETRLLAHDVEAHGRRWAVRIRGLPVPVRKPESSDEAKELVIAFLNDHLNIQSVLASDINCAHRIGGVKGGKQAILTRFFR
jgi:chromosome segregation ATPase